MRRLLIWITLLCFASHQITAAAQTPAQEGAAAAAAANITIQGFISTPSARAVLPSFSATPPETAYYGQPNLSAAANARIGACAGAADATCQATTTSINSALAPRPVLGAHDAAIAGVSAIADNPASALGDLSTYYSGCTTTNVSQPSSTQLRQCLRHVGLGNIRCAARFTPDISTRRCEPGHDTATQSVQSAHSWHGDDAWMAAAVCAGSAAGGTQLWRLGTAVNPGRCANSLQTVTLPTSGTGVLRGLNIGFHIFDNRCQAADVVWTATGCTGNTCRMHFDFRFSGVTDRSLDVSYDPSGWVSTVTEHWDNQCAILEANRGFGACTHVSGPVCVDGPSTKTLQGQEVAAPCWEFQSTYRCNDAPAADECAPLAAQGCVRTASACRQALPGDPLTCGVFQDTYQCSQPAATRTTVSRCDPPLSSPDADFARTVTFMEAGREAGRYVDPVTLRVFKGADNRCDRRLFGLTNCCKGGGTDAASLFNNASMASTATTAYQTAFSTYTYDALFVSDAPSWVLSAFEALSGTSTGFSSALAGVAAGDVSFMSFLSSISAFTWIAIIVFIIQISGILDCPESAQVTAMKRDSRLCVDLGEYCSSRLPVVGTCVTRTRTFCCFNSRLSRLINEQGRAQLGMPWGSPEQPRCDGFTIAELQRLDFAAMDLSEFYADIVPTLPNVPGTIATQQSRVPQCYFGQGKC